MLSRNDAQAREHIAWIDFAKGLTIVLVVVLYANEWADTDACRQIWLKHIVDFFAPVRMPAFFLISGLLVAAALKRDWRSFLDRKVVHFAYFYLLWLAILIAFQAPRLVAEHGWPGIAELYFRSLGRPYSMLWFIYLLPVFFVVTRLLRHAPAAVVWTCAAAAQIAAVETDVKVLDKFTAYFVYFYSGYVLAPRVLALAKTACRHRLAAVAVLAAWAVGNGLVAGDPLAAAPGIELALGMVGAASLVAASALLAGTRLDAFSYCGRQSLTIYLGFYIPLAIAGSVALSLGLGRGSAATLAALAGVIAPLVLHRLVRGTRLAFLFERPAWTRVARPSGAPSFSASRPAR